MPRKTTAALTKAKPKKLTAKQLNWAKLVACGGYTDVDAYVEAYGCTKETAEKCAFRNRSDPRVMQEVMKLRGEFTRKYADLLSSDTKRGRLVEIMLLGKDQDSIRAIAELNRMEEADGMKEGDRFIDILIKVAETKRKLPHEDPHDIIEV